MKKLIFLLLLAQTISFLYSDAGCLGSSPAHSYHGYNENPGDDWGMQVARSPKHTNCDCNCTQYARAHNRCINCGHINVPKSLIISNTATKKASTDNVAAKTRVKAKATKAAQKKAKKQQKTA